MFGRIQKFLLEAKGTEGGSTTGESEGNKVDPEISLSRLVDRNKGDHEAVSRKLYDQTYRLRRKGEEKDRIIADLRRQVPAEGSRVLTREQAAELDAIAPEGTSLKDVAAKLKELPALQEKVQKFEASEQIAKVVKAARIDPDKVDVIHTFAPNAKFEVKVEKDAEDNEVEVVYVKDGASEAKKFDEFFVKILPAIRAEGSETTPPTTPVTLEPSMPQGTPRRTAAPKAPKAPELPANAMRDAELQLQSESNRYSY